MNPLSTRKRLLKRVVLLTLILALGMGEAVYAVSSPDPVFLVARNGQQMVDELGAGKLPAFIAWEPYCAEAVVEGYGRYLLKSSEIWPHHPCCIMAYDLDWYNSQGEKRANEILNRVLWVHLKANQWINEAKDPHSKDHHKLLTLAGEFTHRDREVIELALQNIDFDFQIDIPGMEVYAQKLAQYDIFSPRKWREGGYESAADYVNSLVDDKYITWAIQNQAKSPGEISLLKVPICHPCCPPRTVKPIPIRFGYITEDLHHLAFYIAWKEGIFSKVGIEVKIAREGGYTNGALEMTQGFKLNKVDIGCLGISPALIHAINSNNFSRDDAKIGIISGVNYNGSAIVAQEGINSIEDLAGKSVGFPGVGTVQHFLFLLASEGKVKVAL